METENTKDRKQSTSCSNLGLLMQQIPQTHLKETGIESAFVVNESDETSRVFPFLATPSGNLKIIPDQVRKISF